MRGVGVSPELQHKLQIILGFWDIKADQITLLAARENRIYRVESRQGRFALKLARRGYHGKDALLGEIALLRHLEQQAFAATQPVAAQNGDYLQDSELGFATLLRWIEGEAFGTSMTDMPRKEDDFAKLGCKLAQFHQLTQSWRPPEGIIRPSWGREGLLGDQPFWGRFWDNPHLSPDARAMLRSFRDFAYQALPADEHRIIHADLVPENILLTKHQMLFIDFDDFGTGYVLFDLATALLKNDHHPQFEQFKQAFIEAYQRECEIDLAAFDLFMAIRAVTYIGWAAARPELDADGLLSRRYFEHAKPYIAALEAQS